MRARSRRVGEAFMIVVKVRLNLTFPNGITEARPGKTARQPAAAGRGIDEIKDRVEPA